MLNINNSVAIACASGGFKAIFVHGVLSALEEKNIKVNAYASASASVMPSALAAIRKARESGVNYWLEGLKIYHQTKSMSQVCLASVSYFNARGGEQLFERWSNLDFYIATSKVTTKEAAEQTQSKQAKRLGKKLLVSAAKGDRSWVDRHLKLNLFSITKKDNLVLLNRNNFAEVVYASTRMLHAWDIPAWVNKQPYIDASYTCACPAIEMVEQGYQNVIAIATEPGKLYRDLFQQEIIRDRYKQVPIRQIKPDIDLRELGVDFTQAASQGLSAVYQHGLEKGKEFLARS